MPSTKNNVGLITEMTSSLSGRPTIGPFDAGLPVTFTCAAVGEDNTKFAFAWVIGQ